MISLNTFACTEKNYILLRNSTDPGQQLCMNLFTSNKKFHTTTINFKNEKLFICFHILEWLRDELAESETNGEAVYIIGHIPIAFCSETWGRVYQAISERF